MRRTLEEQFEEAAKKTEALRKRVLERRLRASDGYMKTLHAAHGAVTRLARMDGVQGDLQLEAQVLLRLLETEKDRLTSVAQA